MLHKEAASTALIETLEVLMTIGSIGKHRLADGTALALQIGHRISVDIDLFSDEINDYAKIQEELQAKFGKHFERVRDVSSPMCNGVTVLMNNIKTDILDWPVKFIRPPFVVESIRMAAKEDIVPMKFNTFLSPPEYARYEKKDYIDIAFLMQEFTLEGMIGFYEAKYPDQTMVPRLIIEGLQLHEIADKKPMPKMLTQHAWEETKRQIEESIERFIHGKVDKF